MAARSDELVRPGLKALAVSISLIATGCASVDRPSGGTLAVATLRTASGAAVGTARIWAERGQLMLAVDGVSLPLGNHGLHLHAVGRCDAPGFTSPGPHLNPMGRQHGTLNPAGSHLGDLPNLLVSAGGRAKLRAVLPGTSDMLNAALFDADGTALVIHAQADDYRTDPSGASGDRIACGVFTRA